MRPKLAILSVTLILGCGLPDPDPACEFLENIALNHDNRKHLVENFRRAVASEEFVKRLDNRYYIYVNGEVELERMMGVNWPYLGVKDKTNLSIGFNRGDAKTLSAEVIESVSVRLGRSVLILDVDSDGNWGLSWPERALKGLKPVEGFLLSCSS